MADEVFIDWIYPPNWNGETNVGYRRITVNFTGVSDATGETDVVKVNLSEWRTRNGNVPSKTVVERIHYSIDGLTLRLEWDRTPDKLIALLDGADGPMDGEMDWTKFGGKVDDGEGGTGDIILTTTDYTSGDTYNVTLTLRLKD